jgi:aerotaxis receptor
VRDTRMSRTDLRGIIVFANDAFVAISGYSRQELIGQSHNLVRHADMPPAAFADLWKTISSGQCWIGLVKNRCKNGDHYWVRAAVSPVSEHGRITGFISVRTKPSETDIAAAEDAYSRIRGGARNLLVQRGQIRQAGIIGWLKRLTSSFRFRIVMPLTCLVLLIVASAVAGIIGMQTATRSMTSLHEDRLVPAVQLGSIATNQREIWMHLTNAAQPDSDVPHQLTEIEEHRQEIAKNLKDYLATYLTPEETVLAQKLIEDVAAYEKLLILPGVDLAKAGKRGDLHLLLGSPEVLNRLQQSVENIMAMLALQQRVSEQLLHEQQERSASTITIAMVIATAGVLLAIATAVFLSRSIIKRATGLLSILDKISAKQLNERIDLSATDEFSGTFFASANLQVTLAYAQLHAAETRLHTMRDFDGSVGTVIAGMGTSIRTMQSTASSQSTVAGQVASNAQTVASSASELNASIREIASQATQVSNLARNAAQTAESSQATMANLTNAAQEITAVAKLIAGIAEQTNLLALNATIEAARAGDVGRGFAVVAGEVKLLANQTHGATGDINKKIVAVQNDAQAAVSALASVTTSIAKLNDAAHAIAAAVEEQAAVVEEVARNAEQAALAAKSTGDAAQAVSAATTELVQGEATLNKAVETFKSQAID